MSSNAHVKGPFEPDRVNQGRPGGREPGDDAVFKALADPIRRALLDQLFERDGQTLGELCAQVPRLTRFGVMKHLGVLESGGLVVTRRVGREKLHYLNPIPIRLIHDRWIGKYAEPWAAGLSRLKASLEGETMDAPKHVYQVYIRTTPERLWQALVNPADTQRYFYQSHYESSWAAGAPYRTILPDGSTPFEGTILEIDPPRRLVYSFHYVGNAATRPEHPSRVTWEIEPRGNVCKLTVVHDEFAPDERETFQLVGGGWPFILSNLKTWLETGEPLDLPERVPSVST
jgi:uncharacterized protein YndB with AHSA1/START domain/DNA-binding transcriptional ArsR family regulator